jgi:hypothetical protein
LREDEFERRIEADIAVDDLAALVDDEERGNRVDAIELSGLVFSCAFASVSCQPLRRDEHSNQGLANISGGDAFRVLLGVNCGRVTGDREIMKTRDGVFAMGSLD